jgi:hypothetical protein
MPKFDHRFDSQIQKKEDLRFNWDDALDFAETQCKMYGAAQNVLPDEGDLFRVVEHPTTLPNCVYFVSEVG